MKRILALSLPLLISATAFGGPFTAGNLVVVTVGDGITQPLVGSATAGNLREYTTVGGLQQTIGLPITFSGSATSEGFLQISADQNYLTVAGYNAAVGLATPQSSAASVVNRVVARVDSHTGTINATTVLNNSYNGSNIRGAVSADGNAIWISGNGGSGQGTTAGIEYTTLGSTSSTLMNSTTSNDRVVNIFNNQLYATANSGSWLSIAKVGSGLPTTTSSPGWTTLPGMPTSGTHSPYDFWFKDANTVYLADDAAASAGGGIQKWTQSGGTWTLQYVLLNNGTGTGAGWVNGTTSQTSRGLAGAVDSSGNVDLFFTTGNLLGEVIDTGVNTTTFTTLATAGTGYQFRGVELIPEPGSAVLGVLGLLVLAAFRRSRR